MRKFDTNVMVVEDSKLCQQALRVTLKAMGLPRPIVMAKAEDAVIAYKAFPGYYDCILMDIGLPDISGLEATRIIRNFEEMEGLPPILICATTILTSAKVKKICLDAGMHDFISKPIGSAALSSVFAQYGLMTSHAFTA